MATSVTVWARTSKPGCTPTGNSRKVYVGSGIFFEQEYVCPSAFVAQFGAAASHLQEVASEFASPFTDVARMSVAELSEEAERLRAYLMTLPVEGAEEVIQRVQSRLSDLTQELRRRQGVVVLEDPYGPIPPPSTVIVGQEAAPGGSNTLLWVLGIGAVAAYLLLRKKSK